MSNGTLPEMLPTVIGSIGRKHILIQLPGETIKRKCIKQDSLLYVAAALGKSYVHLPGFNDQCLRVGSLSNDILRAKVMMYKVDSPKTFTAIIDGSGFAVWNTKEEDKK